MLGSIRARFATTFTLAVILIFCQRQLWAIPFAQFDPMSNEEKAEFFAALMGATEAQLNDEGQAADVTKIEDLFTRIEPGDSLSLGMGEWEGNVDAARLADAKRYAVDHSAARLQVEVALIVTLKKNGIVLSKDAVSTIYAKFISFHRKTYAEFEALPSRDQANYIALLVRFGWPDYEFLHRVESRIKGEKPGSEPPEMNVVLSTKFPLHVFPQPGFRELKQEIDVAYTKLPSDPGTFYQVIMYILRQEDVLVTKKIEDMKRETYHLPSR